MLEQDIDCLAKTIYGEARGEFKEYGLSALIAIGNVVLNRYHYQEHDFATIKDICLKPYQFSCWLTYDSNFKLLNKLNAHRDIPFYYSLAGKIISNTLPDLTGGANHYHANYLQPYWADKQKITCKIGNHYFYKL